MQVTKDSIVTFDYTLTNGEGKTLDTSEGKQPLSYLHGHGKLVPGMEKAMEGKKAGDTFTVTVTPEEGYGQYDKQLLARVEKSQLPPDLELKLGMPLQAQTQQGVRIFYLVKVEDDAVILDGNHPLAGMTLHFDVDLKEVREATQEELEHAHAHGPAEQENPGEA